MTETRRSETARGRSILRFAAQGVGPQSLAPSRPAVDVPPATVLPGLALNIIEVHVRIESEQGLVEARRQSRDLATRAGFRLADCAIIAAIVSELGRNILLYAVPGEILIKLIEERGRLGIQIRARDAGPGIADISRALRDGFSSSGRSGIGLPGVRRLADDFRISCQARHGTEVLARKWRS